MATLRARLTKVEAQLNATRKSPVRFSVINIDAPDADERLKRAKREYKNKFGSLSGLRVIRTHIPEPKPVPSGFQKPSV